MNGVYGAHGIDGINRVFGIDGADVIDGVAGIDGIDGEDDIHVVDDVWRCVTHHHNERDYTKIADFEMRLFSNDWKEMVLTVSRLITDDHVDKKKYRDRSEISG